MVITGTGRAGTTFLVQLLTALGLDTGYETGEWGEDYFAHCSAGLERDILEPEGPYIVKNPRFCETLDGLLASGKVIVDHALIPMRDLEDAARSRARVGGHDGDVPGGLWGTHDADRQPGVLAEKFHQLMRTLARHDVPCTLLDFPRFARDADYAFSKLGFLAQAVDRQAFHAAFGKVARPELIHDFRERRSRDEGAPARRFLEDCRRVRRVRRAKRVAIAIAALAAGLLAARMAITPTAPPPHAMF